MRSKYVLLTMAMVLVGFADPFAVLADEWPTMPAYSDEFNDPDLDPKWSFDNPAPNPGGQSWSLTLNPGFLRMTTTGPTDLVGETNTAPKMLEQAPAGNFRIVVRVLAAPDVSFEHAGILVMQSPTSWVRLIRDSNANSVYLQSSQGNWQYRSFSGSDVILRLTKLGSSYEGAFSINEETSYTVIGHITGPAAPDSFGTVVASTPPGNVFTADFDYFRVFDGGPAFECSDGIDNDGNGCSDYPFDSGCDGYSDDDESGGVCSVSIIALSSFSAIDRSGFVEVVWVTETEIDNAGFNIYRSLCKDCNKSRLNEQLIPAKGDGIQGASYSFEDHDVAGSGTYYYWLEDVDMIGNGTMQGPILASKKDAKIPAIFSLAQNYPNPFNPMTEIRYDLPVESGVRLDVYDVRGQRVATLVDGIQTAGTRVVRWTGKNERGVAVSGGIYFYRLEAGEFVDIKKMVLLK